MSQCSICKKKINEKESPIFFADSSTYYCCIDCETKKQVIIANEEGKEEAIEYFKKFDGDTQSLTLDKYLYNLITDNLVSKSDKLNQQLAQIANKMMLTSGNDFYGYKIVKYIDVIFEEKITGIGIKTSFKAIGDIFASLTGDEYHALTERISDLKLKLKEALKINAAKLGANAIVGIDYETTLPGSYAIMVSINGTAVIVKKCDLIE